MKIAKSITGLAACSTLGWNLDAAYSLTLYAGAAPTMNESLDQFDALYDENILDLARFPSEQLEILNRISAPDNMIFRNSLKADCKGMIKEIGIERVGQGLGFVEAEEAIMKDGDNPDPSLVMVPHGQKGDDGFQVLYLYQKETLIPSAYFMTDAIGRALVASTGHMVTMSEQFVRITVWRKEGPRSSLSAWESGFVFGADDMKKKYDVIKLIPKMKDSLQLDKFNALVETINRTAGERQKYFLAARREAMGIIPGDKLNPIECLKDATITEFDFTAPTTTYVGTHKRKICYVMPGEEITATMLFGIKHYALLLLTSHIESDHLWAQSHVRCFTPGAEGRLNVVQSISAREFYLLYKGVPWNFYELQPYSEKKMEKERTNSKELVKDLTNGELKANVLKSYECPSLPSDKRVKLIES